MRKNIFYYFYRCLSKFTYVYLMRIEDEAFEKFKIFKEEIENNTNKKIKVLRFDRGGEYRSNELIFFCD